MPADFDQSAIIGPFYLEILLVPMLKEKFATLEGWNKIELLDDPSAIMIPFYQDEFFAKVLHFP